MGAFSWSATRVRTFQECRRKYYYRYHLAPRARRPAAPAEALQADRVKDLVGLEAWAGDLVHRVIEEALNRWRVGVHYAEEHAEARAQQLLSRQFRDSRQYWTAPADEFPRRPVLLDLHYYDDGGPLSRERAGKLKTLVMDSLRAFLRSDLARHIRDVGPRQWLPIERNAAARLEGGLTILVKPDFAFRDGDLLHVVDWKTGRTDTFWEMVQVTCYALYAREKWRHPAERIVPQIVHLHPEFHVSKAEYSPESVRDVQLLIRETHEEMLELSGPEELPSAERFECTEDCGRCRWCPFRGLCEGAERAAPRPAALSAA